MKYQTERWQSLDALRGFLALYVCGHHFTVLSKSLWDYLQIPYVPSLFSCGHEAVIGFFLLSGFVIMKAHGKDRFHGRAICRFLFLRFRRLYGIYLIALFLSWLFMPAEGVSMASLGKELPLNLLFLQDWRSADPDLGVFYSNGPLWSLPYEVAYYLTFPFLMAIRQKVGTIAVMVIILGLSLFGWACELSDHKTQFSLILALGGVWWLGAALATDAFQKHLWKVSEWPAFFFLGFIPLFNGIDGGEIGTPLTILVTLAYLPLFLFLMPGQRARSMEVPLVVIAVISFLWLGLLLLLWSSSVLDISRWYIHLFPVALPILVKLLPQKICVRALVFVSLFSYALYVIHYPIFRSIIFNTILLDQNVLTLYGLIIVFVPLTFFLAWFMECKFQKWWAKALDSLSARFLSLIGMHALEAPEIKMQKK